MSSLSGKSILILEDENLLRKKLSNYLNRLGADVFESANILSAKDFLKNQRFDVCLFDINLPDGNSLDLLKSNIINSETIVIVMTSDPSMQTAIDALKFGAKDYLTKPFESAQSLLAIQKSFKSQKDDRIKDFHKNKTSPFIFGKSLLHIEKQFELLTKKEKLISGSLPPPVLIEGETGTGKSALAKWIHYNSNRSKNEFIQINCANLQEQIAESELFGHEKGSFTDAKASRIGLFEAADESTLFLDEIASLNEKVQAKILTILDDGILRRVGGNKGISVNVKIIVASNIELEKLVAEGKFRGDLYYRLNLIKAKLPPLRLRGNDVITIANSLLKKLSPKYGIQKPVLSKDSLKKIKEYNWPGNVRELSYEIERSLLLSDNSEIDILTNYNSKDNHITNNSISSFNNTKQIPNQGFDLEIHILDLINTAINQSKGNVSKAARLLNVPRDYIRYKIKKK